MGVQLTNTGSSDQFDDIIMDPESAEGNDLSQDNQGYESSEDDTLETFDNVGKDSQVKLLDEKDDKDPAPEDKDEDEKDDKEADKGKEEVKEGDKKPESDEKSEEKAEETKDLGKTIKAFKDGSKFEVPQDATVKVKVDGRSEKVTIQELRDNYSGKQSFDKKFSELESNRKSYESEREQLTRVQTTLRETMGDAQNLLKEAIDLKGDPMAAVNKIVDLLQVDAYDFNRALFNSLHEQVDGLNEMDEFERQAYWLEKKNEHLQNKHQTLQERTRESQAREERESRIDKLRESNGVSEEDFVSAYEELSQNGEEVTSEQVVRYAANLPFLKTAEDLLEPYEDRLSDDEFEQYMSKVASVMKNDKSLTREDVETYLAEMFVVDEEVSKANAKAERLEAGKNESNSTKDEYVNQSDLYTNPTNESFDDF